MTASGFFSSAIGWKDLQYIGNVFNPGYDGCPPAALDKLGVSYDLMQTRVEPAGEMSSDNGATPNRRLGVGFIGSGFNARFHMQAFRGVRDADVLGVWSPNKKNAASAAELARDRSMSARRSRTRRSPTWSPIRRSTRSG